MRQQKWRRQFQQHGGTLVISARLFIFLSDFFVKPEVESLPLRDSSNHFAENEEIEIVDIKMVRFIISLCSQNAVAFSTRVPTNGIYLISQEYDFAPQENYYAHFAEDDDQPMDDPFLSDEDSETYQSAYIEDLGDISDNNNFSGDEDDVYTTEVSC